MCGIHGRTTKHAFERLNTTEYDGFPTIWNTRCSGMTKGLTQNTNHKQLVNELTNQLTNQSTSEPINS